MYSTIPQRHAIAHVAIAASNQALFDGLSTDIHPASGVMTITVRWSRMNGEHTTEHVLVNSDGTYAYVSPRLGFLPHYGIERGKRVNEEIVRDARIGVIHV